MPQVQHRSTSKLWQRRLLCAGVALTLWACKDDRVGEVESAEEPAVLETVADEPSVAVPETVNEPEFPGYERSARAERVAAMDADLAVGAAAFQVCAACHGAGGFGSRDGVVPRLAGQHREVLLFRLIEISDGVRIREDMEAYKPAIQTDEQISALSSYIEALPDPDDVRHGSGDGLEEAAVQYGDLCASCHGEAGEGSGVDGFPRIGGWDVGSIQRTLLKLQAPDAEVHETGMSDLVSMLTEAEIAALADYVSRLDPGS